MVWRRKSFEVLPALSVRGRLLRRNLRTVTLAWMIGSVWMAIIAGSRTTIFGRMLGFNNFHFGLMAPIPFLATFGQLPAAILIERTGLRKYQFVYFMTLSRMLWLAVAAIPLVLPIPSRPAVWTMMGILAASSFLGSLAVPAWWMWMGDLIPRRVRGRYFGARQRWSQLIRIPMIIVIGIVLDGLTVGGRAMTAAEQPALLWAICGVFAFAALCGMADTLM